MKPTPQEDIALGLTINGIELSGLVIGLRYQAGPEGIFLITEFPTDDNTSALLERLFRQARRGT